MTKALKHLELAKRVSIAAPGVGSRGNFRLGAVLFKGKRVYTAKHNSYRTHPALAPYTQWPNLHAESACIIAHGLDNCRGLDLLVVRTISNTSLAVSKPCPVCMGLIRDVGISSISYINEKGKLKCEKISRNS